MNYDNNIKTQRVLFWWCAKCAIDHVDHDSQQVSVVKFNNGFSNCIVNVHVHRNLLLDNKRAITGLRWCVYSKSTTKYILFCMKLSNITSLMNI